MIELTRQEALDILQSARQDVSLAGQSRLAAKVAIVIQMLQDAWADADLLDAPRAEPERAPVDGWCPCGGSEWDEKNIRWMTQIGAGCTKTAFFGLSFCPRCGAALRDGYAERGGDTRRVDVLEALAEAAGSDGILIGKIYDEGGVPNCHVHVSEPTIPERTLRAAIDATSPAAPGSDERGSGERVRGQRCLWCGNAVGMFHADGCAAPGNDETGDNLNE